MDKGDLVPDEIVIGIIAERYDQPDCAKGAVFDGFPRTIPQAEALDAMLEGPRPADRSGDRIEGRRCGPDGRVEQRIKASGGVARADDTPETLKNRLAVYYKNTAPLIEFYRKQGKLGDRRRHGADRGGHQSHRCGGGQGWPEGVCGSGIGLANLRKSLDLAC